MKRLVLLGGGHAQIAVLASLAEQPLTGCEVRLITPYRRQIYSGMLPGWVAGHYPLEACAIGLDALAARAGVAFHQAAVIALDPPRHALRCDDGTDVPFDLLSIDTGPVAATDDLPGSVEHALPIRPIEGFVAAWPELVDRVRAAGGCFDLVILGAGAAGVELAFAMQHRAMTEGWSHVRLTLVGSGALPLDGAPHTLRKRAAALLAERAIAWVGGSKAERIEPNRLCLVHGAAIDFDACLVVTGAAAPAWPRAAGLDRRARFHPSRPDPPEPVAQANIRRRRRGGLCGRTPEIRRLRRAGGADAGPQPARHVRRLRAAVVEPAAACALPRQHRRATCTRLVGPMELARQLGLALEGPHRPAVRAPVQ